MTNYKEKLDLNYKLMHLTMNLTTLLLIITLFCITTSCKKDDNNPDCVKEENYFTAEFDGQRLEPYWRSGFSPCKYTFNVSNSQDRQDWELRIGIENPDLYIYVYMIGINEVGNYSIETGDETDLPNFLSKTYIYIYNENYNGDPNLSAFTYFSLGDTGNIEITEYNSTTGLLVGTFSCIMYSTHNEGEEKEISGEFNINLTTHDTCVRPCWL